ncbi:uncharacterized protein I206_102014 [Kwoniella pini CBS 10737]|uniref:MARVEL domain-containing protein n=1 Tax=Kwoniella pini CBS 10737 TaxID=1296096 RepID=A0A1B9HV34_9TREE|nr:uncharacterized protein I206_06894 [Kwoniella pini CBS 10737]OCF47118.1 hypothetical protein I206_06894 [Kwoniella pini CBS 10737]
MEKMRDVGKGLIDPKYCCCAVPLVNAGIYIVLSEQALLSLAIGIVVFATPDVVGASFPAIGGIIFAILCFVIAAVQPIGFIGVLREKTSTFKVYSLINALAILAALICAAALIITSALQHNKAVSKCETKFFSDSSSTSSTANETLASEGQALCSAFAWADVGIMGALWVILLVVQGYFIYLTRTYSTSQVKDHKLYHSVYSENPEAFTMSILRSTRYNPGSVYNSMPPSTGPNADAWDARPSMDSLRDEQAGAAVQGAGGYEYGHQREYSNATVRPVDEGRYDDATHGYEYEQHYQNQQPGGGYEYQEQQQHLQNGQNQYPFSEPGGGYVDHPAEAYHDQNREGITPTMNQYHDGQGVGYSEGGLRRPEEIQSHPGGR